MIATGTFQVEMTPEASEDRAGSTLGRLALDKTFHGDLEGTSHGTMLTARGSVEGSAGYVALERVEGVLHGREGAFVLQHGGVMSADEASLSIRIVPDTGSGALVGISGTMEIERDGEVHRYTLAYTLP